MDVFEGKFEGVGSGGGFYGPAPARILPSAATNFWHVRLFFAVKETDEFVVEKVGWLKPSSKSKADGINDINIAMSLLRPYDEDASKKKKEPYGARKEQYRIMHGRYVPKWYVPEIFEIGIAHSAPLRQRIFQRCQMGSFALGSGGPQRRCWCVPVTDRKPSSNSV